MVDALTLLGHGESNLETVIRQLLLVMASSTEGDKRLLLEREGNGHPTAGSDQGGELQSFLRAVQIA